MLRKSLLVLAAAFMLLVALSWPASASATGTLDQQHTANDNSLGVDSVSSWAQSFTAGITGNLDQVDVGIVQGNQPGFCSNTPNGNLIITIRSMSGGVPSGVLATMSVPAAQVPVCGSNTFLQVPVSPVVPVVSGTVYAIAASYPTGTGSYTWRASVFYQGTHYAGGQDYLSQNGGAFVSPGRDTGQAAPCCYPQDDLNFKTYVTAGGGGVSCTGGNIYQNLSGVWSNIPGAAKFLDVDSNNGSGSAVYALGTTATSGGCLIYKRVGGVWTNIPGGAVDIAADNTTNLVAVQDTGVIYQYNGATWTNIPGLAHQVTNGAFNGGFGLHALGSTASGGNYQIYRYIGGPSVWQVIPGAASQIAWNGVDGTLWAVQASGAIYHYVAGVWQSIPGLAKQVSAGYDGTVYALGTTAVSGGFQIYKYIGGAAVWQAIPGGAQQLAGGGPNELWAHQ